MKNKNVIAKKGKKAIRSILKQINFKLITLKPNIHHWLLSEKYH